jgi:hypothetical protein
MHRISTGHYATFPPDVPIVADQRLVSVQLRAVGAALSRSARPRTDDSFKIDPPQPCSGEPEAADGTSVKACETEDLADWLGGRHLNPDNVVQRGKK